MTKEILEIKKKKTVTKMNAYDGLTSRLNTAEGRISELHDMSVEASKRKAKRKTKNRTKPNPGKSSQEPWDNYKRYRIHQDGEFCVNLTGIMYQFDWCPDIWLSIVSEHVCECFWIRLTSE